MPNPLALSVNLAAKANEDLRSLFGQFGTMQHPNGAVLQAYRPARLAIKAAMRVRNPAQSVRDTMSALRNAVRAAMTGVFIQTHNAAVDNALQQLAVYGVDAPSGPDDFEPVG